jgi:hypothetical protein
MYYFERCLRVFSTLELISGITLIVIALFLEKGTPEDAVILCVLPSVVSPD